MFGFKIGSINFKNAFENALWIGFGAFLGSFITYKVQSSTMDNIIEQMTPAIEKAIDKESITNTIHNAIDLKIDKIKKSDSINININQKPINNQKPKNVIIKKTDSIKEEKRSWFGNTFFPNKKNKKRKN